MPILSNPENRNTLLARAGINAPRIDKFVTVAALFLVSLILLCSSTASAKEASAIASEVKAIVKKEKPCWKIYHEQERKDGDFHSVEVNWVCGKDGVIVYLYQVPSVEAAAKLLREIITSPVQSSAVALGTPPIGPYQFGDETHVGSNYMYSSSSYVYFRKGNIVFRIDSGATARTTSKRTLKHALRFAQWFSLAS
jgi:hypothetical protein